jgi:hypothetical protein
MTATEPVLFDAGLYRPIHIAWEIGTHRPSRRVECGLGTEWWISPNEARRVRGAVSLCADCVRAHNATHRKGHQL